MLVYSVLPVLDRTGRRRVKKPIVRVRGSVGSWPHHKTGRSANSKRVGNAVISGENSSRFECVSLCSENTVPIPFATRPTAPRNCQSQPYDMRS